MNKFIKILKKIFLISIIYITLDIMFMAIIPIDLKNMIYDKRSHKIKSYYYHHDLRPNAYWTENWGSQTSNIYTNNLGFKDKQIRNVEFRENNILFIGDSFTEGVGVEYENTFVGIIDEKISSYNKNYNILNAGVVSYSPIVILSKLNYLINIKKFPITKVFVVLCNGDIHDDLFRYNDINNDYVVSHNDFLNIKVLVNLNNFIKSNTLIYQFIKKVTPLSNLIKAIKNKKPDYKDLNLNEVLNVLNNKPDQKHIVDKDSFNEWGVEGLNRSTNYIKQINDMLSEKNIDLSLIFLEESIFMLNSISSDFYKNHWEDFSNKNNIDFIFVNEYHKNSQNKFEVYKDLFFIGDNHFNNKGNKVVANEIISKSKYLKEILN